MSKYLETIHFIRGQFPGEDVVPLHRPKFDGNEKSYLLETINSTYACGLYRNSPWQKTTWLYT